MADRGHWQHDEPMRAQNAPQKPRKQKVAPLSDQEASASPGAIQTQPRGSGKTSRKSSQSETSNSGSSAPGSISEKSARWASRIVGEDLVSPRKLIPNALNWRRHPKAQQIALAQALDGIGWIQRVIVNKRTGNIVDGHLRVELAIKEKEKFVPVCYVDLSDEEERLALATFDPLSAMAITDQKMLDSLIENIGADSPMLAALLAKHSDDEETASAGSHDQSGDVKERYEILITCENEVDQADLLFRLTEEGVTCRSLIS